MLLTQFPDINQIRRLKNEPAKPAEKWNNVVLNFKCKQANRTGIESPYSLFLNTQGFSYCNLNGNRYRIETDSFLLAQPGEIYDLTIDNRCTTEISNIHINYHFFNAVASAFALPTPLLLHNPEHITYSLPQLYSQLHTKTPEFTTLTTQLCTPAQNEADFEYTLSRLIEWLLLHNDSIKKQILALPPLKAAVKADVYKRLTIACDYITSNYHLPLDLDGICAVTCLSKFHFLRLFKACYGITPYQFLVRLRLEKGSHLLKTTTLQIQEIADSLGFEYPNSFIKAFQKYYGYAPGSLRKA